MRYCYCEAKVRSSNVSVVYVVRLRILKFSKAALQKSWGSMEPIEPPLDPPLSCVSWCLISSQCLKCVWCHTVKFFGLSSHALSCVYGGTPLNRHPSTADTHNITAVLHNLTLDSVVTRSTQ